MESDVTVRGAARDLRVGTVAAVLVGLLLLPGALGSAPSPGARAPAAGPVRSGPIAAPAVPLGGASGAVVGTATIGLAPTHDQPTSVTVDPADGELYVTNFGALALGGNTVSVLGDANRTPVATIPVGDDPISSVYDPADGFVYVLNYGTTNNVSVLSGTAAVAAINTGASPRWAVYDAYHRTVVVANTKSGNVSILQGTARIATVAVGTDPSAMAYDPTDAWVYVPNGATNNVTVLNGSTVVGTVAVGSGPSAAIYDPADGWIYVVNTASNNVTVINGTTAIANLTIGTAPLFGDYDAENGAVYVANGGANTVSLLNGTRVVGTVAVGSYPRFVAYDPSDQLVYVEDWTSNDLTVLNGSTVVAFVATEPEPYTVVADPLTGYVDVPDFGYTNLSIVGTPAPAWNVTVTETGLPSGTPWAFEFDGTTYPIAGTSVSFPAANGSYAFATPPVPGVWAYNGSGTAQVAGAPLALAVDFQPTYGVAFVASGLRSGTVWNVSVGNGRIGPLALGGSGSVLAVELPNGTYTYAVTPIPGYARLPSGNLTVAGAGTTVNLSFVAVTYPVDFVESGLPNGTLWWVAIGASNLSSTSSTIGVAEINGSYAYRTGSVAGFEADNATGGFVVNGSGVNLTLAFNATFAVTVIESGLPFATPWTVVLGPWTNVSTGSTVGFVVPNGTYAFTISASDPAYVPSPQQGRWRVDGAPRTEATNFTDTVANATPDEVVVTAVGLPTGTPWSLTWGGAQSPESASPVSLWVAPGTYLYAVSAPGYAARPDHGGVSVVGPLTELNVTFTALPPTLYEVSFQPSGLPEGLAWNLTLNGTVEPGTGDTAVSLRLPNGSYAYTLGALAEYTYAHAGRVTVAGAPVSQPIAFHHDVYPVRFQEIGYANGTSWSVSIGAQTNSSTTDLVTLWETNGSYAFTSAVAGSTAPDWTGQVVVNGAAPPITVGKFGSSPSGAQNTTGASLTPLEEGGIALGALALGALAYLAVARPRRRAKTEPSDPETGEGGEPPY